MNLMCQLFSRTEKMFGTWYIIVCCDLWQWDCSGAQHKNPWDWKCKCKTQSTETQESENLPAPRQDAASEAEHENENLLNVFIYLPYIVSKDEVLYVRLLEPRASNWNLSTSLVLNNALKGEEIPVSREDECFKPEPKK